MFPLCLCAAHLQPSSRSLTALLPTFEVGNGIVSAALSVYGCGVQLASVQQAALQVYDIPVADSQLPQSAGIDAAGFASSTVLTVVVTPFLETQDALARFTAPGNPPLVVPVTVSRGGQGVVPLAFPVKDTSDMPDLPGLPLSFVTPVSVFTASYSSQELGLTAKINASDGLGAVFNRLYFKVVNVPVTDTGT